jgi:hypothetical protein
MRRVLVLALLVAGLSLLLVRPAPSYDPWAWLLWGDQVASGRLSTLEGPSFKPLPVAVCAVLAPLGAAAPWLWVLLARTAAVLAVLLVFGAGRRLAGGSVVAGALAAVGVLWCGPYLELAAAGASEGFVLALALAGVEAGRTGHSRWALACGVAAGLVRVETWPFLLVAGVVAWRRRPQDRPLLVAAALVVPLAWIVPEVLGSGQALRSATRARVPNPGQPGLADVPVLASLRAALALPLAPLWAGVVLAAGAAWHWGDHQARAVLAPAAVGLAWVGIVAAMAGAGFSGEPRYAVPGAALVAAGGAVGLVVVGRRLVVGRRVVPVSHFVAGLVALLVVLAVLVRAGDVVELRRAQAYQWRLQADLAATVAGLGGAGAVLACGQPYVGPLRGPLLAHHLGVARDGVEPDQAPQSPGVVFRSSLHPGDPPAPAVPAGFDPVAGWGPWQVFADCTGPASAEVARPVRSP